MPPKREAANRQQVDLKTRFLLERQAAGWQPGTLRMYQRVIEDFQEYSGCSDVRQVSREAVAAYAEEVLSGYPLDGNGRAEWLGRLKTFFRWAVARGGLLVDPAAGLRLPASKRRKYPVYLTQSQMAKLLDGIDTETPEGLQDRAMLELLYSSGLRTAEMCNLTGNDINFAEGTVRVLMGKGKKDRMVPVGRVALRFLDRYIGQVRGLHGSEPLFCHPSTGRKIQPWYLRQAVARYAAEVLPRSFRHSFAIHMLEGGASIRHIQAMMGHASLKTTQKYTHIMPAELKRAHSAAHPVERRRRGFPEVSPVRLMNL
jgi:integrase/recombinase XerD